MGDRYGVLGSSAVWVVGRVWGLGGWVGWDGGQVGRFGLVCSGAVGADGLSSSSGGSANVLMLCKELNSEAGAPIFRGLSSFLMRSFSSRFCSSLRVRNERELCSAGEVLVAQQQPAALVGHALEAGRRSPPATHRDSRAAAAGGSPRAAPPTARPQGCVTALAKAWTGLQCAHQRMPPLGFRPGPSSCCRLPPPLLLMVERYCRLHPGCV